MIVKLIVTKGQDDGKIYYVRPGETRILGRSSRTDITVRDVGASRLHCEIRNVGGRVTLADMNSRNGTSVNSHRVMGEKPLQDKDVLGIGTSTMLVRLQAEDASAPAVQPASSPHGPREETADFGPPVEPEPEPGEAPSADAPGPPAADWDFAAFKQPEPEPPPEPEPAPGEKPAMMGSFEEWLDPEEPSPPDRQPAGPGDQEAPDVAFGFAEPAAVSPGPEPPEEPDPVTSPAPDGPVPPPLSGEEAPSAGVSTPESAPEAEDDSRVGTTIGGCRIEAYLGTDGTSRIYRAVQESMDRPVMLKVLAPDRTQDERAVLRFLRAARSGGRLSHPNIVQVFDAGVEQGLNFIAFEFVEGESVQEMLGKQERGKPLDLRTALEISEQIAGALDHAHEQGVVHRNIKVDSVYVTRHGVSKLADMGFAKPLAPAAGQQTTLAGERLGDLFFAAPEQLVDAASAGPPADIYSLGAVLFVMLTGYLPFRATDEAQIMERVQRGQRESIERLNPSVPDEVRRIVDRAMDVDASRRYRRAGEMQSALRAALDHIG